MSEAFQDDRVIGYLILTVIGIGATGEPEHDRLYTACSHATRVAKDRGGKKHSMSSQLVLVFTTEDVSGHGVQQDATEAVGVTPATCPVRV